MPGEAFLTKQFYSELPVGSDSLCLSLLLTDESLMYSISTDEFSHPVELCELEFKHLNNSYDASDKLSLLINNYQLHQKKFTRVNLCMLNQSFTMVPEAYADSADIKKALTFSTGVERSKSIQHSLNGLKFYFALDLELYNYLERTFPNASIRHSGAVIISLILSHRSLANSDILLNIGEGVIEIAAKRNNKLLFYNVFNCSGNEDILYYLLFAMEQFAFDPLSVRLSIAAQRPVTDELFKTIKKYIRHADFCVTDQTVRLTAGLVTLPQHYYFTLFNQHLCEL